MKSSNHRVKPLKLSTKVNSFSLKLFLLYFVSAMKSEQNIVTWREKEREGKREKEKEMEKKRGSKKERQGGRERRRKGGRERRGERERGKCSEPGGNIVNFSPNPLQVFYQVLQVSFQLC